MAANEELVFVVLVEEFDGINEVGGNSYVREKGPHIFMIETWESGREVKEEEGTLRVGLEVGADGLVHVYNVG